MKTLNGWLQVIMNTPMYNILVLTSNDSLGVHDHVGLCVLDSICVHFHHIYYYASLCSVLDYPLGKWGYSPGAATLGGTKREGRREWRGEGNGGKKGTEGRREWREELRERRGEGNEGNEGKKGMEGRRERRREGNGGEKGTEGRRERRGEGNRGEKGTEGAGKY